MKFLLTEDKFILNENYGFILEERFNLEEDILLEAQATLKQLVIDLNKLDTLLPTLLEVLPVGLTLEILDGTPLEGEKLDIEDKIKAACAEVQDLLKNKKNFKELLDKIRAKAVLPEGSFTEEEVKILQPLCYNIASNGISVKDRLRGIKSHKGELSEQVATLQERLPKLKAGLEELYKFFEKEGPEEPVEDPEEPKIKYSLKNPELELKVGETSTIKILGTPKPDKPVKAAFSSSSTEVVTVSNTGEVKAIKEGAAEIKVTVADQTLLCKVTVTAATTEEPPAPVTTDELDWAQLYKECSECKNVEEANNAFWNGGLPKKGTPNPKELPFAPTDAAALGYYKGEWGDKSDLVASFGTPFMTVLKKIGWTAILNPFVSLLKHLFKSTDLKFTDASFTAILTAYDTGLLNEADLRGEDKGKLGELNLVRNPQLYTKSVAEITEYLTWQKEVRTLDESKIPSSSSLKIIYANIVAENGIVEDIDGDANDLTTETTYNTISSKDFRYDIRPLTKYKEIIKSKLKLDGDKPKVVKATDADITNIIAKITDAATAKKFLAYLLNYYRVAKIETLNALLKNSFGNALITNRNATTTTFEEDKTFDKLLQGSSKRYSTKQLTSLISEVLKIAGLAT